MVGFSALASASRATKHSAYGIVEATGFDAGFAASYACFAVLLSVAELARVHNPLCAATAPHADEGTAPNIMR